MRFVLAACTVLIPLSSPSVAAAGATYDASVEINRPRAVRAFGAAGSFGGLAGTTATPSGHPLAAVAIRGWGFLPGQSAYFPAVAPDGTVVIANEPQTDNQLLPTARQMALTTFDPSTGRFANSVVPTSTGRTELGGPWPHASGVVGGGDISDVGVVRAGSTTRVVFTSAMPFWGWSRGGGEYPTFGMLHRWPDGSWSVDRERSRTASQLATNAAQTAQAARARAGAARVRSRRAARTARRAASAVDEACVTRHYPGMAPFGDCRMPAEFVQLPASDAVVLSQYAFDDPARPSGRLTVIEPLRGGVLASYAYPPITLTDGSRLAVHPREVVADPLGRRGDERFVVIFDAERGDGQAGDPPVPGAIQEFTYDAAAGTITPTSAPVLSGDRTGTAPLGFETAAYDDDGNLWAGQSLVGSLQAGPLAIYERRSGARGTLGERAACRVGASWSGASWGRACAPDRRVGEAAALGIARSLDWDADGSRMLLTTMTGAVLPIRVRGDRIEAGRAVDLGLNLLADRSVVRIGPRKAALDARRHTLWIPIQQLATERTCAAWPCAPRSLDQWLFAVDLSAL